MIPQDVIEETKKEMILEAIPLFESFGIEKKQTEINFDIREENGNTIIDMVALVDGEVWNSKSRTIKQLNG